MLKTSSKMRHYSSILWMNISGKKWIVHQAKKFGICSQSVLIQFKIYQIVHDKSNVAVTHLGQFYSMKYTFNLVAMFKVSQLAPWHSA